MRLRSTFAIATGVLLVGLSVGAWRASRLASHAESFMGNGGKVTEISLISTESKREWIEDEVFAFNDANPNTKLTYKFIESRGAMQSILYGKEQPCLWSPDSPGFVAALSDNWKKSHPNDIVKAQDPAYFRVYQRSPLVFLTTDTKAKFLRPLLGGPDAWEKIRQLSQNPTSTPWKSFQFSHANPTNDATALLMLSLILNQYALDHGQSANLDNVASSDAFGAYLAQVEQGLKNHSAAKTATYKLTSDYVTDPTTSDFIVTTENLALRAAVSNPHLAVIYPSPTAVTEESVCVVNGPWLTSDKEQVALQFMQFLAQSDATREGLKLCMRPTDTMAGTQISPRLAQHSSQGFNATYSSVELPSYTTLNSALFIWRKHVAHTTAAVTL